FVANPSTTYPNSSVVLSVFTSGGSGPLSYSYGGLPAGCVSADVAVLLCTPLTPGNASIIVTVTDAVNSSASATTLLVVVPRPALGLGFSVFPTVISLGGTVEFTATAANASGGVAYSYSGLPPGCSSSPLPVLECVPTSAGNFSVQLRATDGLGRTASSSTTLEVQKPAPGHTGNATPPAPMPGPTWGAALILLLAAGIAGAGGGAVAMWAAARARDHAAGARVDQPISPRS
ncbi:MAG: PKD domain-containing protein, partial [Thermoplasmata archaeon]|nr:PKD domain-containing protein [Thermoplasmata archaeon]